MKLSKKWRGVIACDVSPVPMFLKIPTTCNYSVYLRKLDQGQPTTFRKGQKILYSKFKLQTKWSQLGQKLPNWSKNIISIWQQVQRGEVNVVVQRRNQTDALGMKVGDKTFFGLPLAFNWLLSYSSLLILPGEWENAGLFVAR